MSRDYRAIQVKQATRVVLAHGFPVETARQVGYLAGLAWDDSHLPQTHRPERVLPPTLRKAHR